MVAALNDITLAQGASGIDVEPFVDAAAMEMMAARKFTQLHTFIINSDADAAFLHAPGKLMSDEKI